jgi:hypothetical protein
VVANVLGTQTAGDPDSDTKFQLNDSSSQGSLSCAIGSEPRVGTADLRWLRLDGKTAELDGSISAT